MANPRGGSDEGYYGDENETEVFPSAYSHGGYSGNRNSGDYERSNGSQYSGYDDSSRYSSGYSQNNRSAGSADSSGSGASASSAHSAQYGNSDYGYGQSSQQQSYSQDRRYPQQNQQYEQYEQPQQYYQAPLPPLPPQPQPQPQQRSAPAKPSLSDRFDIPRYVGSVVAVAVVAALTAYVVGWILDLAIAKIAQNTSWVYTPMDRVFYAIFAAVAAVLAGILWWVLNIATTLPSLFYNWIVGVLLAAAVILPLLLNDPFYNGILQSVMHLVVGLPVVYLVAPIGNSSIKQ